MSTSDSKLASMEDNRAAEGEEGTLLNVPSSTPPVSIPSLTSQFPTTTRPDFTGETVTESKAASMASNDCSAALSSPAEASPAKPAVTSTSTLEGTIETSPATSHIASASDSLTCTGTTLVNTMESPPMLSSTTFGGPNSENNFPALLTFKGVTVTLENNSVWKQFYSCGTEMILTKPGRRMFPYCRYRLSGLDPERLYSLVLSIVPSGQYRYRWSTSKWEVNGPAEHQAQGLIRAFSHHYSPCKGSEWMSSLVSFYKLKLTNNSQDQDGHIILHSMHRYIPRLHVIPVPDGVVPTSDKPVVMGPESITFTFPQTEFMAVTTYQNFQITQLKINHNPFAKGFREDGNNPRLNRIATAAKPAVTTDTEPQVLKPEPGGNKEVVMEPSAKNHIVPASLSNVQETRLVLKPIMSNPASKDDSYVPCIRGKHALGELVLVQTRPLIEPKEESDLISVTPDAQQGSKVQTPKRKSMSPASAKSTPGLSPHKKRKRVNRRWANSRGKDWKAVDTSPAVVHSPSLTVAMQPELDDVEGLLFVSFTSKEALEVHVRDKPVTTSSAASPVSATTPIQSKQPVEVNPDSVEEKIARLEAVLLNDLRVLKHRQVIHPVLQAVGLKLISLDLSKSIDLKYLGVCLPLPPPKLDQSKTTALSVPDEGLPFISRTGKTSDMTKIKGWKNKFIRSKETSPSNCDGLQKNLSAFCSNMLDEYLENEAQQISERAAAFSTCPEDSVAYQLPAKSSSYVKTLDSVLKHRTAASKFPVGVNRPCPLSHKPLLYSALTSPPPPLASAATPGQSEAPSRHQSASLHTRPDATSHSSYSGDVSQRSCTSQPGVSQRPAGSFGHSHGTTLKPSVLTKLQLRMLRMESEALSQGLTRTHLTPNRLSVALSVMLTKETLARQVLKVAPAPNITTAGSECGQEFCRLGCVCSSLQQLSRGPLHCRRPECMFGCACFKRKITKQPSIEECDQQTHPVYFMTSMENVVQPRPGSHANKLWEPNIHDVDSEPLFAPKSARPCVVSPKAQKRYGVQTIREEDKDPVYKYFESMMTCARVRGFNSKPPPEVTIELKKLASAAPRTTTTPRTTSNLVKNTYSTTLTVKKPANMTSQENTSIEAQARKQVQIQSECQWMKDRTMILKALCQRMNDNRLSRRFYMGPYCINPVDKIFMQKPSGSIVTYRVLITKPSKASDCDEDELDDCEDDEHGNKTFDGYSDAEEDDEPEMKLGVTPFLSGLIPAGKLEARTKPVGCQAAGLIQVNGKSYNQARLLVGNMGSLHPANRLAAYVTGRLKVDIKKSTIKNNPSRAPQIKIPGTVLSSNFTAMKPPTQQPGQFFQPERWRKRSISLPHHSQNSSTINSSPLQSLFLNHLSSSSSFQTSSTNSPVSLTVSPSLKSPSFLGHSGTYSFRICPPSNQGDRDQKQPGVTLPGGFTLIQLPKPGADGAAQQSEPPNTTNKQKEGLVSFSQLAAQWFGLDALNKLKSKSVEPGSSRELICVEKMQSHENFDTASDDLGFDSSDYSSDDDSDDDPVDIETVEEVNQGITITKVKEAIHKALRTSRESGGNLGSFRETSVLKDEQDDLKNNKRRKNHTALERQRRSEQKLLFDRLQTILQCDSRTPRSHLLSLAIKEIHLLVKKSKSLEERKKMLTKMQSTYVQKLSRLSGKSEELITLKLKEICDRDKRREKTMKWRPVFSQLLQSKAALLQAIAPEPKPQPPPQPQSNSLTPVQAKPPVTLSKNNVHSFLSLLQARLQKTAAQSRVNTPVPAPHSQPQAASSEAAPSSSTVQQVVSLHVSQRPSKLEGLKEAARGDVATGAQDGASPSTNCNNPEARPPIPLTIPIVRSKTGRIILPSSLKPIGQGFYRLMVMKPKEKGEDDEASPSVDPLKNQEKIFPASYKPLEDKSACSGAESLAKLALINKSISVPLVDLKTKEKSQEQVSAVSLNTSLPPSPLTCNSVQTPAVVEPEPDPKPDPSPPVARRQMGRPRKNPVPSVSKNEKPTVEEEARKTEKSEVSALVEERRGGKIRAKRKAADTSKVADSPAQDKPQRGCRKNSVRLQRIPVTRAAKSTSISSEDSPVKRRSSGFKSPDASTTFSSSRPLTRGALGKDFPSAKKRSWIDVEKELEPDVEYE
ncbi:MAX gene-associated protein [Mugil cephalus]|uniref:MAX gene-associated protein n=1 Tax=Mugil cephalus TaxID=48193 RepID=UPI001FB5B44F|nr:MAX gene-associated protein [Mugil cephalus]